MTYPQVKLDEAFWFQEGPGVRKWQFTEHGIKLLNVGNILKTGTIDLAKTDRHLSTDEVRERYSHFLADAGDLVIASSGISIDNDELLRTRGAFIEEKHLPLCMNTSTIRFKAIEGISNLGFLKHWLQSREFRVQITREVTGIAQKNFGPSHLKRLHLRLPPLAEQKRIAGILDAADALRAKRRESLAQLDILLQSTFLDMFGDPVTNPMGWNVLKFERLGSSRLGKMLDKGKQAGDCQFPYLANFNVQWGRFELQTLRKMDFTEADREEFSLKSGDLLICEGGEVGRTAVWRGELRDVYFQKALHRVRLDPSRALPEYIRFYMWFMAEHGGFSDFTNSATIAHLTGVKLKSLPVPLPSIEIQRHFAAIVESVDQQKASQRAHLDELDSLFASLQSRAFHGDL